jgi:hypothetical protein
MVNIEGIVLYKLLELGSLSALADLKSCFLVHIVLYTERLNRSILSTEEYRASKI